ncbi:MAG: RNase adapter RapZ [Epsilonproteobacteria bacterium]|nr:RNase adapter RapZ [Campylobacterota bacterium]
MQQIHEKELVSPQQENTYTVVVVTGLSGAGKTSVMRALEDLGFYCVDNLPVPLISTFLSLAFHTKINPLKIGIGIDARGEQFLSEFMSEMAKIKQEGIFSTKIIFLNARTQTLLKRFQETRRKHPLAEGINMDRAIEKEKELLEPIMSMASMILDTDEFNIHELRKWVRKSFSEEQLQELLVNLLSFGFKYGVPSESNLVYDLRFLPNPHFIEHLKPLTGKNKEVQDYLFNNTVAEEYWEKLSGFLHYSLEKFYQEGRFFVTVAIGCTGGKHRSVTFVEKLSQQNWPHIRFLTTHRDIERE